MTVQATVAFVFSNEPPLDVCWHNLRFADQVHHLELFAAAASAWLKQTGADYQQLERELRQRQCHTHLIAVPNTQNLTLRLGERVCHYQLIFSCRPRVAALAELHQHWASYDENFARLADAGDVGLTVPHDTPEQPQLDVFALLARCQHKLALAV